MRRWLENLNYRMNCYMYGRYGVDGLSKFMLVLSLVLLIASNFLILLYPFALALMIFALFRCYSKNIVKRQSELSIYLKYKGKVNAFFSIRRRMLKERKINRYYKCPVCKAYLKVPKGKGKIEISCPKCHNKIIRKT